MSDEENLAVRQNLSYIVCDKKVATVASGLTAILEMYYCGDEVKGVGVMESIVEALRFEYGYWEDK